MKFERKLALLRDSRGVVPVQFAALCTRKKAGKREVLLITSRDTGRWVLPKGWQMTDRTGGETALTEAWEEAGVIGALTGPAIGCYLYPKMIAPGRVHTCRVEVHPVRVDRLEARFPERGQRRRKWMSAKKAAKAVQEPELAVMLRNLPRN